ncbi:hypothetical protein IW140_003180 [Coemansia sp. RSA 1813]|nr:hypothetical protein EV178_003138 [Coemansia sp. RSA 1646]KAJ1773939.1 hypothetical protein LPJ74_000036 [Coemansia sp. RSA 1843]KAJ2089342.1 hypothetical protein IW138_003510 [Coemansia sp. RSA 986]KAJ2214444.1 hypothetical protein EV179_002987 [Coemansia sp. RSA 487]KAJ2569335.1 hypothetical protein IW140_003180 [Coemansia sp. RSA 1813]
MNTKLALALLAVPAVALANDNVNRRDGLDNIVSNIGGAFDAATSGAANLVSKATQGAVSEFSRLKSDFQAGQNNSDEEESHTEGDNKSSDASRTTYASIAGFAAVVAFTQFV